ncbi:MAG TPA: hypothetical protein VKV21_07625 [Solirubrobacteraceae bacterium]|nr:hypothetical protein [Solirubrobacteraceae bacterium]
MSTATEAPARPATGGTTPPSSPPGGFLPRAACTLGLAAALVAISFLSGGGVDQNVASTGNTWTEIALIAVGALAVGAGIFRHAPGERRSGWITGAMMALLFADTAASISWSWAPDSSWLGAAQMLAYLSVFAGAIMLARPWARGWAIVLGALLLWSTTLCAWSLLVKVFPSALAPGNQYGRLQAPFGYWNAIALCAAMGVPACLWLGTRREGGRRIAGLAAPALTLLISVLVLSYSRSADAAAAAAAALWLIAVPRRLRAVALLVGAAAGAGVISAWFLTHHGLAGNAVPLSAQDHAGHGFGLVLLIVVVLEAVVGVAASDAMDRTRVSEEARRRIGAGLIALLGLGIALGVLAVALSSRGLTGEISYRWHELTNPAGTVSAESASRVFQFGSSRPLYWHEALFVGKLAYWKGVGELGFSVARLLDPQSVETVFQAHSYVFETYADLGALGCLLSAGLLVAWLAATGRSIGRRSAARPGTDPERIALITLAVLVVGFGIQSTLDWTWYFTGLGVPVLLAAGWVAGRGPGAPLALRPRSPLDRPGALVACAALAVAVVIGGWLVWRPLHSAQLLDAGQARAAQQADPFSLAPYESLATLDMDHRQPAAAVAALQQATRVQPHNPESWEELAQLEQQLRDWPAMLAAAEQARARVAAPNIVEYTAIAEMQLAQDELQAAAARAARAHATPAAGSSPSGSRRRAAGHRRH